MQEMHDGIGSNLSTALAVARQQKQPASTIQTLNRALADLKITIDWLEPVEGDVVALTGSLRHRMAGDLRDAGVVCKWEVEQRRTLLWLDAANVLSHSEARIMRIGCREYLREGIDGIAAYVADNGCGFDANADGHGKGLSNIRARALSVHGEQMCESSASIGTTVTLWLPYKRRE